MKHLEYDIDIAADRRTVWNTMLQPDTYKEWVKESWPDSFYEGRWQKGEEIRFLSPEGGGTVARIVELKPHDVVMAEHVGVINADGSEDRSKGAGNDWIGTTERYTFRERNGKTNLKVEIDTTPDWEAMFNDGWPGALKKLKEITEKQTVSA